MLAFPNRSSSRWKVETDTDVGGVTVIFAVAHGGREGIRDTHVEFAVSTQRGHRPGVPPCVSTRHSRIIWTHRT